MSALGTYLQDLRAIHASGAGVAETSYYGALEHCSIVPAARRPQVRCVLSLRNRGAGMPDGGL